MLYKINKTIQFLWNNKLCPQPLTCLQTELSCGFTRNFKVEISYHVSLQKSSIYGFKFRSASIKLFNLFPFLFQRIFSFFPLCTQFIQTLYFSHQCVQACPQPCNFSFLGPDLQLHQQRTRNEAAQLKPPNNKKRLVLPPLTSHPFLA